jgi:hypothetical protein
MIVLALDPGSEKTAYAFVETTKPLIYECGWVENFKIPKIIQTGLCHTVACEHIQCQGMAVGKSVFETCYWIGEFRAVCHFLGINFERIYRSEEKMHLCGSMRAKDSNIRQVLLDRFPASGGGKCPQIGTKKKPGPLYGVSGDIWSAIAVAFTFAETKNGDKKI